MVDAKQIKRVRLACYTTNVSMSVVSNISAILFLTFRTMYGISYSLLGFLVLVNFVTQLTIDLIFSFFSHKFDIAKTVKAIPILTIVGLLIYALWPSVFPDSVYIGLVIGTIIYSASGGLSEVLISPVVAALPAEDPDREMSKLHSVYAWGVVFVVIFATLFLLVFGIESWQVMVAITTVIPIFAAVLYFKAQIPPMKTPEKTSGALALLKQSGVWLCFFAIFLGGAAECTMAQWSSGYLEQALQIPKVWGDIFGVALYYVMLGLGRTLYSKYGKNINPVLIGCAVGATVCYFVASVSFVPLIGLIACAMTGLFTSMLWPGSLIVASSRYPSGGVFIFAIMAAGGDLGASVVPQLLGIITDKAMVNQTVIKMAESLNVLPEQLGMKIGMLVAMIFPLVAIVIYSCIHKSAKKQEKHNEFITN